MVREYAATLRDAVRDRRLRTFLIVRNLGMFVTTMWTTYSVIYLTDERGVGLAESSVALLPFVSALATIAVILLAAERLTVRARLWQPARWARCCGWSRRCFYVLSPARTIWFVVLWAIVSALSTALFRPAEQSYWASVVGDRERAQVFSASSALMALVALPAGPLAGALYTLAPRGPFWLAIVLQLVALGLILSLGNKESQRDF